MTEADEQRRARRRQASDRWRHANPEKIKEATRLRTTRGDTLRLKHGMLPEELTAMYIAQNNRCYLCGGELGDAARIDHYHGCCPANRSCRYCRRGLACHNCNIAIGLAADDPERLRRMADNLEAANRAVEIRMTSKAEQDTMW